MQQKSAFLRHISANVLIAAGLALASAASIAQNSDAAANTQWSFSTIAKDVQARHAFEAMARGHQLPGWVKKGVVESPAIKVDMDGRNYLVMQACKPHQCASQQIAVMYAPAQGTMYGVLLGRNGASEKLTWLNIGGGSESIDGKTILYAALTGSLSNHPQAFQFH